jgi:uncharacterized membrane protein YjgN (DUF898 family)
MGWLRGLPALGFLFLFPYILPLMWTSKFALFGGQIAVFGLFAILWPVARVGAYRYRMNRMSWRGIRFSFRGKTLAYLGQNVLGYLLATVTLGLYMPFMQVRLRKMLYSQTYFGNGAFQFSGRGRDLLPVWIFALPFTICTFGLAWAWWSALRQRYFWANTTFNGVHFRCTATAGDLLGLWTVNFMLTVFTVGLGASWVMVRTLQFWSEHIQAVNAPPIESIYQDAQMATATGESFADFLGFDFGF